MMRYIFCFFALFFISVQFALASTVVRTGDTVAVDTDQKVEGNFYILASTALLSGASEGDVTAVAAKFNLTGPVAEDVLALALSANIDADVSGDVRVIAADTVIDGQVSGGLVVVAGDLKVLSGAKIDGDVLFVGGNATIEGVVTGQVLGHYESLRIDGAVGAVDVVTQNLQIGDRANITGDIRYQSNTELVRGTGAIIAGAITRSDVAVATHTSNNHKTIATMFLVSLFTVVVIYLFARKILNKLAHSVEHNTLELAMLGLAVIIFVPFIAVVLLVTILGSVLGVLLFSLYVVTVVIAFTFLPVVLYAFVMHILRKPPTVQLTALFLGTIGMYVLSLVPVVGIISLLLVFSITVGWLTRTAYRLLRRG